MDLKDNYIVKSVKSRPVLFMIAVAMSSILTFMLTENALEVIHKKVTETQQKEIFHLATQLVKLETQIEHLHVTIDEEFDPETGKMIRKRSETRKDTENTSSSTETTIKDQIISKYKKTLEEEIRTSQRQNYLYGGIGWNAAFATQYYVGYSRRLWLFDVGILTQVDSSNLLDSSAGFTFGLRF